MIKGILGKKLGMSQVFMTDGRRIPVTVVEAGPCVVLQKKTVETDGYSAIQVGFGAKKNQRVNKPEMGHFRKVKELFSIYVNFASTIAMILRWVKQFHVSRSLLPGTSLM